MTNFHKFGTEIGTCGIVWRDERVVGFSLPEATDAATRARLRRRFPEATEDAPTATVQRASDGVVALIAGEKVDLNIVDCDLIAVPDFILRVYDFLCAVPPVETIT